MTLLQAIRPILNTKYEIRDTNLWEGIFLFLFLVLLPFQTRLVLFSPHPFNEWHAGFLYASDIAFLGLLAFIFLDFFSRPRRVSLGLTKFDKKVIGTLMLFFIWAVISVGFNGFSAYHLLKLCEGLILFFYFFFRFPRLFSWKVVAWLLVVDAFVQSLIASAQFILQHSLGLWFFRESPLAIGKPDVAQIVVHGVHMIRAYGTFPSPNVLAAFLAVSLFFLYALWREKINAAVFAALQFVILAGLFFTFSRAILILFLFVSVGVFIAQYVQTKEEHARKRWRNFALVWLIEALALVIILFPELTGRFAGVGLGQEAAMNERLLFNVIALQSIQLHPFFGVGIGNFVSWFQSALPGLNESLYQPVHNVLLLIGAEMGLPATLFFIGFFALLVVRAVKTLFQRRDSYYLFLCACAVFIFLVGMEDHLFWTIQQTTLLFWVVLGMVGGYGRGQVQISNVKVQNYKE